MQLVNPALRLVCVHGLRDFEFEFPGLLLVKRVDSCANVVQRLLTRCFVVFRQVLEPSADFLGQPAALEDPTELSGLLYQPFCLHLLKLLLLLHEKTVRVLSDPYYFVPIGHAAHGGGLKGPQDVNVPGVHIPVRVEHLLLARVQILAALFCFHLHFNRHRAAQARLQLKRLETARLGRGRPGVRGLFKGRLSNLGPAAFLSCFLVPGLPLAPLSLAPLSRAPLFRAPLSLAPLSRASMPTALLSIVLPPTCLSIPKALVMSPTFLLLPVRLMLLLVAIHVPKHPVHLHSRHVALHFTVASRAEALRGAPAVPARVKIHCPCAQEVLTQRSRVFFKRIIPSTRPLKGWKVKPIIVPSTCRHWLNRLSRWCCFCRRLFCCRVLCSVL